MRLIKHLLFNLILSTALYFGLFHQINYALNISIFVIWVLCLASLLFAMEQCVKEVSKSVNGKKMPKIRKFVSYTAITINLSMLVVSGYFASAVVVLISLIMHAHLYSEVDKHLTDIAE